MNIRGKSKSMLSSKNLRPPAQTELEMEQWLTILGNELYERLLEDRETNKRWPKTLNMQFKVTGVGSLGGTAAVPMRTTDFNDSTLVTAAIDLLKRVKAANTAVGILPCSYISMSLGSFIEDGVGGRAQGTLTSFFKSKSPTPASSSAVQVVTTSKPLGTKPFTSTLPTSENFPIGSSLGKRKPMKEEPAPAKVSILTASPTTTSEYDEYVCPECGEKMLQLQRTEHDDFHLACHLSEGKSMGSFRPQNGEAFTSSCEEVTFPFIVKIPD